MWRDDPHFVQLKITPKPQLCQTCGCQCNQCTAADGILDYQHRIEQLERELREYKGCSNRLETQLMEVESSARTEQARREDEMNRMRDRYDRLMESHKKLSRLNQTLEDQLLTVVTKYEGEKSNLIMEIKDSHSKLEEAKQLVIDLETENKRCKTECSIAVQLLQTRPNDYVSQKLGSLPDDLKERIELSIPRDERMQMLEEIEENKKKAKPTLTVMPTFPPCAALFQAPHESSQSNGGQESAESSNKVNISSATSSVQGGSDGRRIDNRQLARVLSETALNRSCDNSLLIEFVCVRCGGRQRMIERGVQTQDLSLAGGDTRRDNLWENDGGRHVHRSPILSSSSFVSAGPYSGAILDV